MTKHKGKPKPPTPEQIAAAERAMQAIANLPEADVIAVVLDALGNWGAHVEAGFTEWALAVTRAAGLRGQVTGEEMIARITELSRRERVLIDVCHAVDQKLQAARPAAASDVTLSAAIHGVDAVAIDEALGLLEPVRLWSYPVVPK